MDHLSCLAFGFASDTPSPGSERNNSRAWQWLRAEGVVDYLSRLAFRFASDALSLGSG